MAKINLLTIHYGKCYGAVMQTFATCKMLENEGHSVCVINLINPVQKGNWKTFQFWKDSVREFKFWLFKVCRNYYFDTLRKNKRLESISDDMPSCDSLVEDVIQKEEYRALYKAISLLKDDYQEVVRLYYFDSMSVKEIASIVGQSTDNVKIQLYRARLKLKELLEATL